MTQCPECGARAVSTNRPLPYIIYECNSKTIDGEFYASHECLIASLKKKLEVAVKALKKIKAPLTYHVTEPIDARRLDRKIAAEALKQIGGE